MPQRQEGRLDILMWTARPNIGLLV